MIYPHEIYIHYLQQLKKILNKLQETDKSFILNETLAEHMFPFYQQVRTTIGFTLRSCCPLLKREIVSFSSEENDVETLIGEIDKTLDYLSRIDKGDYVMDDSNKVKTVAGFAELELPAEEYFTMYTLPNFFFHYAMVYAIAKKAGLAIGKADYDGYHEYPPGFSFV